jgi:hypothetical protein
MRRPAAAVPRITDTASTVLSTEDVSPESRTLLRRSATFSGASGLVFAALFLAALVLLRQAPRLNTPDAAYTAFYSAGSGNVLVTLGMHVVPFAGIAFLWHMSATRTLIDAVPGTPAEVQRWLQVTSGIVFVCMLFAGTAAVAAVALLTVFSSAPVPPPSVARTLSGAGYGLVFVFGVRAAGMFIIATTTLLRTRRLLPRWLAVLSHLAAGFLLVSTTFHPVVLMVFPAWVACVSVALIAHSYRSESPLSTSIGTSSSTTTPSQPAGDPGRRPPSSEPAPSPQETSHEHDHRR